MTIPQFTMRQLLEAGVHFGHQTHRWNPKMQDYLFGTEQNPHYRSLEDGAAFASGGDHRKRCRGAEAAAFFLWERRGKRPT